MKNVDLVVACDGFPFAMEIIGVIHSGYLDYKEAFQTVVYSYCHVKWLKMKW